MKSSHSQQTLDRRDLRARTDSEQVSKGCVDCGSWHIGDDINGVIGTCQNSKAGALGQGPFIDRLPVCKILCVRTCVCLPILFRRQFKDLIRSSKRDKWSRMVKRRGKGHCPLL